ncbi:MAG: GNAT family N-acetyltransferase [Candidatus Izemoplasmatales bacterium]
MAFRLVREDEREALLAMLYRDPFINLFIIGDIEFYGLSTDFQTVYVDGDGVLETVVLRHHANMMVFSTTNRFDPEEVLALAERHSIKVINVGARTYARLSDELSRSFDVKRMTIARMAAPDRLDSPDPEVRRATVEDVPAIVDALYGISEFVSNLTEPREERLVGMAAKLRDGFSLHYVLERDGHIIAHASSTAHSRNAAMVVAVFTRKECRREGCASKVVSALCRHLLESGRMPVLFFDNPAAATIYHRLGFEDVDGWMMAVSKSI